MAKKSKPDLPLPPRPAWHRAKADSAGVHPATGTRVKKGDIVQIDPRKAGELFEPCESPRARQETPAPKAGAKNGGDR